MPKVKPLISKHWDGYYFADRNLIVFSKDRSRLVQIGTLIHELTHWFIYKLVDDKHDCYFYNKLSAVIDEIQSRLWF